jgi:homoserine O-acetyltransferase
MSIAKLTHAGLSRRRAAVLRAVAWAFAVAPSQVPGQGPVPVAAAAAVAHLGTCTLASGATVPDCRIAYRAFGRLSPARDNAILIPTFFAGRSEDHLFMLGAYVDTTKFHVIIADAFADGLSSSPSNAGPAARQAFRDLTIGDMVDAHHRLLTETLGIRQLRAVVGISMGGFQVFEWAVRYPTFASAYVPIVGSPRVTASDRLIYRALISGADNGSHGAAPADSVWEQLSRIETLFMRTPEGLRSLGIAEVDGEVTSMANGYRRAWALDDYAAQMRAIERHDITTRSGGDLPRAARAVRGRMLVVYSPDDRMVSSEPAAEFARLTGADALVVPSACGHSVFWCDAEKIGPVVRKFVERPPDLRQPSDRK